jgi:hypothetical protein
MNKMMDVMKTLVYTLVNTKTVSEEMNQQTHDEQTEHDHKGHNGL